MSNLLKQPASSPCTSTGHKQKRFQDNLSDRNDLNRSIENSKNNNSRYRNRIPKVFKRKVKSEMARRIALYRAFAFTSALFALALGGATTASSQITPQAIRIAKGAHVSGRTAERNRKPS